MPIGYPDPTTVQYGITYGATGEQTGTFVGIVDYAGVFQGVSGILDGFSNYYGSGILDNNVDFQGDGILDASGYHYSTGIFDGTYQYGPGIFDGISWYEYGIFDGISWYEYGIFDGSSYYESGIFDGSYQRTHGIWDGSSYYESGVFDGTSYATGAVTYLGADNVLSSIQDGSDGTYGNYDVSQLSSYTVLQGTYWGANDENSGGDAGYYNGYSDGEAAEQGNIDYYSASYIAGQSDQYSADQSVLLENTSYFIPVLLDIGGTLDPNDVTNANTGVGIGDYDVSDLRDTNNVADGISYGILQTGTRKSGINGSPLLSAAV